MPLSFNTSPLVNLPKAQYNRRKFVLRYDSTAHQQEPEWLTETGKGTLSNRIFY